MQQSGALVFLGLALLAPSRLLAQCAPRGPVVIDLTLSTQVLERRVGLFSAAGQAVNRLADLGLDRLGCPRSDHKWRGIAVRFGRLYLVNLPIAALVVGIGAHGEGHFAQARYRGIDDAGITITRWPWPMPYVGSLEWIDPTHRADEAAELALTSGGEEGSRYFEGDLLERVASLRYDSRVTGAWRSRIARLRPSR